MKCSKWVLIVPGKVHDVAGVSIAVSRQQQHLFGDDPARSSGDLGRADHVDIERQVRAVLLDGATRQNTHLAEIDRVVDLGPGELFITKFRGRATGHGHSPGIRQD